MIGDVSGHGYQAALIMALTMSASAIHSQTTTDPGEMLNSLVSTLRDELTMTEMFISAFYGVIDPDENELHYSNTGHPHAFLVNREHGFERLPAIDPPLGMNEQPPVTARRRWRRQEDLLVLFTDGVSDARNRAGERLGEERVIETIRDNLDAEPKVILERIVEALNAHTQGASLRDDLTVVLVRT
jgi:sigma-B regulation protein RsbU (phosphoserine phosphatase)